MNLKNPKEFFVHHGFIHKNISQFRNIFHHLRDSNSSLWPIFQGLNYLIVSCFSHKFPARILINWRGIFKNQESLLFFMDSFETNSLHFHTSIMDREIWRCLWGPFFRKFIKFPRIRFAIFGLIVFKYFDLSYNLLM